MAVKSKLKPRHIAFIRKNRLKMSGSDMERKFGFGKGIVTRYMRNNGLAAPRKLQLEFRIKATQKAQTGKSSSTPRIDKFLKKNYLTMAQKRMVGKIGKSQTFIVKRLEQLGLVIPPEIIQRFRKESQIKKGNVPANKGKKMSRQQYKRCQATMFKKGHLPVNTKHNGCITTRIDETRSGKKMPYKWIRIKKAQWKMLHVYNWEKKYGRVPKGYIIVFKNGDTLNCKVSNLKKISQAQHMENTRNSDEFIAKCLAAKKGGKGIKDKEMYAELLKNKPLLDLHRTQLLLKKEIKKTGKL